MDTETYDRTDSIEKIVAQIHAEMSALEAAIRGMDARVSALEARS